nr:hypothetical protein [Kiritimatiellia bacterium]
MKTQKTHSPFLQAPRLILRNQKRFVLNSVSHLSVAAALALLLAQPLIGNSADVSWNPPVGGSGGDSS